MIYIVALSGVFSQEIKYCSSSKESAFIAALKIIKEEDDDYKDVAVYECLEDSYIDGKEVYRLTAYKKFNSNKIEIKEHNKNKIICSFLR